jgi:hypothetical protein
MGSSDQKPAGGSFVIVADNPSPSKQYDEFYKWVGICIKVWATVEDRMFDLCKLILKADPKHVSIIYYRTPTIDAKLTLTTDLIETVLPQRERKSGGKDHPDVVKWNRLVKETKNLLKVRNQLAHASVGIVLGSRINVQDNTLISQDSWLQVFTGKNEQLRGKEKPTIKDSDLPEHYTAVRNLANRFGEFQKLLSERLG